MACNATRFDAVLRDRRRGSVSMSELWRALEKYLRTDCHRVKCPRCKNGSLDADDEDSDPSIADADVNPPDQPQPRGWNSADLDRSCGDGRCGGIAMCSKCEENDAAKGSLFDHLWETSRSYRRSSWHNCLIGECGGVRWCPKCQDKDNATTCVHGEDAYDIRSKDAQDKMEHATTKHNLFNLSTLSDIDGTGYSSDLGTTFPPFAATSGFNRKADLVQLESALPHYSTNIPPSIEPGPSDYASKRRKVEHKSECWGNPCEQDDCVRCGLIDSKRGPASRNVLLFREREEAYESSELEDLESCSQEDLIRRWIEQSPSQLEPPPIVNTPEESMHSKLLFPPRLDQPEWKWLPDTAPIQARQIEIEERRQFYDEVWDLEQDCRLCYNQRLENLKACEESFTKSRLLHDKVREYLREDFERHERLRKWLNAVKRLQVLNPANIESVHESADTKRKRIETAPEVLTETPRLEGKLADDAFALDLFTRHYLTTSEEDFLASLGSQRETRLAIIINRLQGQLLYRDVQENVNQIEM